MDAWIGYLLANDTQRFNSIAYGNGKFVTVGSGSTPSNRAAFSEDGINWTIVPSGNDSSYWESVIYYDR